MPAAGSVSGGPDALRADRGCHPAGPCHPVVVDQYIIPDVYVRKRAQAVVDITAHIAPGASTVPTPTVRGDGEHTVLRNQLQEARWLVRSLEIRNETLLKVAMCIVDRQSAFMEQGEEAMRPMVLRDDADSVQMHESTISRVTANKYMHTPRGVFEFRHFFSSQVSGDDGSDQSSTAVRAKIRRLVGQETRFTVGQRVPPAREGRHTGRRRTVANTANREHRAVR